MIVGVISDTHGLLRPEAVRALEGADLIVHAGDVGTLDVLERLRRVARTSAVRGNVDVEPWATALPETDVVPVEDVLLYVHHGHRALDVDPVAGGFAVVVSGHTHRPRADARNGVLYLNPGSAGPRRFSLPVTVARLTVVGAAITHEIIDLAV